MCCPYNQKNEANNDKCVLHEYLSSIQVDIDSAHRLEIVCNFGLNGWKRLLSIFLIAVETVQSLTVSYAVRDADLNCLSDHF